LGRNAEPTRKRPAEDGPNRQCALLDMSHDRAPATAGRLRIPAPCRSQDAPITRCADHEVPSMDPSAAFYQTLTGVSFTLLGLWFGVMQFAHGGWRSDPERHRSTVHIAMHFFMPGVLGLGSLLGGPAGSSAVWRVTFVIGGVVGLVDSVSYLFSPGTRLGRASRILRMIDPLLWALVIIAAFVPQKILSLTPLQIEGAVTGLIFISGLYNVWLAFTEPEQRPSTG
jgi:hypothetical protein